MGRWAGKYVIGLTGNIAMGKSAIRKMLEHLGAYTIDADGLAHQVMVPGAPAYQPVIEWFGKWILDNEGKIDRAKLGAAAFSHPEALGRLEALTHPIVGQGIDTLIRRAQQPIVVIEAIKLIDGFLGSQVDAIWVVDSAPQIQLERLMKRGFPEAEARKRINMQNPQRDKLARADVVISNNGTLQDAWVQVEREWKRVLAARGLQGQQNDVVGTARIDRPVSTTSTLPVSPVPASVPIQPLAPRPDQPAATAGLMPQPVAPMQTPSPAPTAPAVEGVSVRIRRGMPQTAEAIARLINQSTGKSLNRMDVMTRFGEKSYLLVELDNHFVGLAGFQVENLITRMDEFIIEPGGSQSSIAEALINAVETASKELQSEVGFMYLPTGVPATLSDTFLKLGYQRMELDAIKVPAWREAAEESQPPNTFIFAKKLRAERVLKPL